MVLQRVEIARLGAELQRDARDLAGRARMIRGQLAALLRFAEAAAARREDDRSASTTCSPHTRAPAVLAVARARERAVRQRRAGAGLERLAQGLRDRVAGAVADLEQPLPRGAAAACEAVTAVLPRELDAELLEPVDRRRRLGGQHRDELAVRGLVARLPDVLGVLLRRVVLAESRLDAALRLRGVARLQRALRRDRDPRAGALRGNGRGEAGGAAADHEHVEGRAGPRWRMYHRGPNPSDK